MMVGRSSVVRGLGADSVCCLPRQRFFDATGLLPDPAVFLFVVLLLGIAMESVKLKIEENVIRVKLRYTMLLHMRYASI